MAEHARLAPSAAHRWMSCPGSIRLCAGMPEVETEYSREGTFAHEVAAQSLLLQRKASTWIGEPFPEFEGQACTAEMAAHLQVYLDAVNALVMIESGTLWVERKVTVSKDIWGTADAIVVSDDGRRLHVIDLKYGSGWLVPVEQNEQLLIYAWAALRSLPSEHVVGLEEVHLHVVQPRRVDGDGNVHRTWTIEVHELTAFAGLLVQAEARVNDPKAKLEPGSWCQFCPAKATCPALHAQAIAAARDVFPDGDLLPAKLQPPHPSTFSNQQLGQLLGNLEVVESWIKAVRDFALDKAKQGAVLPGWKLVETLGNRRWQNGEVAAKKLFEAGIDPWAPREVVSPAEAERRLGGKKRAASALKGLTERIVNGVKLVEMNDKRPEIAAVRAQAFLGAETMDLDLFRD